MIRKVIVLGSGTAGLIAALTLKRRSPELDIEIIRDPDIGVIGVGEETTPIPVLRDKIVQQAVRMILEPIWENDFADESIGY